MKKIIIIIAIMISSSNVFSQPNWLWARNAGGVNLEDGLSIAVDGSGNCYAAGYFESSSIIFGSDTLNNSAAGNEEIFIVKCDNWGNVIWAKSAGNIYDDRATSVAVDGSGNCYMTGYFAGNNVIFDNDTLLSAFGASEIFVVKYSPSGNVIWAKSVTGVSSDYALGITVDNNGNSYITGSFESSSLTFDSFTINGINGRAIFIAKYNTSGNVLWAKSVWGSDYREGNSIAVDGNSNCYITGYFKGSNIIFGSDTLTNLYPLNNTEDIFIAKYDALGNAVWAKSAGSVTDVNDVGINVAVDGGGNSYITGYFSGSSITFGSITLTNNNSFGTWKDIFTTKYNSSGNVIWAKKAGGNLDEEGHGIAVDGNGNVYMTGDFNLGSPNQDILAIKYNSVGNVVWTKFAGGYSSDGANDIAIDASGNCYLTGIFVSSTAFFDNDTLANMGAGDVFIAKLADLPTYAVEVILEEYGFFLFPNPSAGELIIQGSEFGEIEIIEIHNAFGEKVFSQQTAKDKPQIRIDLSYLKSGIYFVTLTNETGNKAMRKFVKM
jgi:hypothetical protein